MGFESPNSIDGNVEKPKTLKRYIDALRAHYYEYLPKNAPNGGDSPNWERVAKEVARLRDELDRLDFLAEWKPELLDAPIGQAVDQLDEFTKEIEEEYKQKTKGKPIHSMDLSLDETDEAKSLAEGSDTLGVIKDRMIQFESGQLYK